MSSAWKWKFWAAVIFTLGGIWYVIPNFVQPTDSAWYSKFVPSSKVQLGLDLQGGIQMTLGVDLKRALLHESERYVRDLNEFLPKESISVAKIDRDYDSTEIHVFLQNEADFEKFENYIKTQFTVLEIVSSDSKNKEFILDISQDHIAGMEQQTIQQALETLRNRLDEFGVAEPSIQAKGKDKIIVQLPGLADPSRAKEILAQTAQLEFMIVDDRSVSQLDLEKLVDGVTHESKTPLSVNELNQQLKGKIPAGTKVLFEERVDPTTKETIKSPYLLIVGERISGDLLEDARISTGEYNQPNVMVQFNPAGTEQFSELTKRNVGKRLAIILDDKVKSAPNLNEHIPSGRAQITLGSYQSHTQLFNEAKDLALVLRTGALPAPIEILENRSVGPSLGKDSIEKGLKAMLYGVALIVLFMIVYYRMSGLVADIAVVVNVVFILACLGLLHGTLTLPGLAGILVSVGMAVDANIIVFERIREELTAGKSVRTAVETGYDRAHLTILDSNLTTIIAGVVLFEFGTGPIKGFAITLIFGLIANYFTSLWFTKLFYDWLIQKFEPKTLSI
jgi:protein-export membrane protein SecD